MTIMRQLTFCLILALVGWSCDKTITQTPDTVPPAKVTDLATSLPTGSAIRLTWRAPGDDDTVGFAAQYDIRYSTSLITEETWAAATEISGEIGPAPAGFAQLFTVSRLVPATQYYFALQTTDEAGNWSGLSNVAEGLTTPAPEAQWQTILGGADDEYAYAVEVTADGGYLIAGFTRSSTVGGMGTDVYLAKLDASGGLVWESTFGGDGDDVAYALAVTDDGGAVLAGSSSSFGEGDNDLYLIKVGSSGELVWEKTYGRIGGASSRSADGAYALAPTADGGFVATGYTIASGEDDADVYLVKTNDVGEIEWDTAFGGADWEEGRAITQTLAGEILIAGFVHPVGSALADISLIRTNATGGSVSEVRYRTTGDDRGFAITTAPDGGSLIVGYTRSIGADDYDVIAIRANPVGAVIWEKTYGKFGDDRGFAVTPTNDGGFVLAGYTNPFGVGGDDIYLLRVTAAGELDWETAFGGSGEDVAYGVKPGIDGGYIVVGITSSYDTGKWDIIALKIAEL